MTDETTTTPPETLEYKEYKEVEKTAPEAPAQEDQSTDIQIERILHTTLSLQDQTSLESINRILLEIEKNEDMSNSSIMACTRWLSKKLHEYTTVQITQQKGS